MPRKRRATPAEAGTVSVLPMELQAGDRLADETGDWEVVNHPWTTVGGKRVSVRMRKVGDPASERDRTWGAHEHVVVRRPDVGKSPD